MTTNPWDEWYQENMAKLREERSISEKELDENNPKTPMTEQDIYASRLLAGCTFLPGSWNKRFAKSMRAIGEGDEKMITRKQRINLYRLVYRHRRQIGDKRLVRKAKEFIDE